MKRLIMLFKSTILYPRYRFLMKTHPDLRF